MIAANSPLVGSTRIRGVAGSPVSSIQEGSFFAPVQESRPVMPDIALDGQVSARGALDLVGMAGIEIPVRLRQEDGSLLVLPAHADAFVSLDQPEAKGIHMSRLYLLLDDLLSSRSLDAGLVERVLRSFTESHHDLSRSSHLAVRCDLPLRRPSLKSGYSGWRQYPISLGGSLINGQMAYTVGVRITYSSTCPCSAALARQLIQERFAETFAGREAVAVEAVQEWLSSDTAILATPHSQRSYADLTLVFTEAGAVPGLTALIDGAEGMLQTPVQAAVKREDEQEFARLNGANLMFCEDACRRLKAWLDLWSEMVDYRVAVAHVESLHPHDAVSIVTKGVPGGLRADSR